MPSIHVLGAYRLELTPELFAQAMDWKYEGIWLSPDERKEAEKRVRSELGSVGLVEVLVTDRDERFSVDDFGQEGSDQAAYTEVFLNDDGCHLIDDGFDVPSTSTLRIAFYLHYLDPTKPLETSYGPILLVPLQPIPKRLADLVPYEPVT